jgi:hypothetical protein
MVRGQKSWEDEDFLSRRILHEVPLSLLLDGLLLSAPMDHEVCVHPMHRLVGQHARAADGRLGLRDVCGEPALIAASRCSCSTFPLKCSFCRRLSD